MILADLIDILIEVINNVLNEQIPIYIVTLLRIEAGINVLDSFFLGLLVPWDLGLLICVK